MQKNYLPFQIEEGEYPVIYLLIRFLKAKYAEELISGRLRLVPVKNYREGYQQEPGKRNDDDEFLSDVHQPDKVIFEIDGHRINGIVGPIRIRRSLDHRAYILCMTAITDRYLNKHEGQVKLTSELISLGEKAVLITDVTEFHRRVKNAVKRSKHLCSYPDAGGRITGLVEYVDLKTHHGEIGPFRKSNEYSFQMEWRLAVFDSLERDEGYPPEIYIEVGDLRDITVVVDSELLLTDTVKFTAVQSET